MPYSIWQTLAPEALAVPIDGRATATTIPVDDISAGVPAASNAGAILCPI